MSNSSYTRLTIRKYLAGQQRIANVVGTLLGGQYVNRADRRAQLNSRRGRGR